MLNYFSSSSKLHCFLETAIVSIAYKKDFPWYICSLKFYAVRIKDNKKRRAAALYPAVETEVRLRRDCGKRESAETVRHTGKSNNLRLQARRNQPAASRPEHVEQFNMVDKSSGYSSTDHSSSGRGSVERLISPQHSFKPERDEAVWVMRCFPFIFMVMCNKGWKTHIVGGNAHHVHLLLCLGMEAATIMQTRTTLLVWMAWNCDSYWQRFSPSSY